MFALLVGVNYVDIRFLFDIITTLMLGGFSAAKIIMATTPTTTPIATETKSTSQCALCLASFVPRLGQPPACTLHPGRPEARHTSKEAKETARSDSLRFYTTSGATPEFISRVANGGYVACGDSGGNFFTDAHNNDKTKTDNGLVGEGYDGRAHCGEWTCGWLHGTYCGRESLLRRWSCCLDAIIRGTFADLGAVVHGHHRLSK